MLKALDYNDDIIKMALGLQQKYATTVNTYTVQ